MTDPSALKVLFVSGFGPVVRDPGASKAFYVDALGLPLEPMPEDQTYFHGENLTGVKHFALWPIAHAARSCFGHDEWPPTVLEPHSWLEFDVEDIGSATQFLKARGYELLVEARLEPWGQTVTRLLSPEGILVGITVTPWLR